MANTVPASLKGADIARFAHRAAQLEKPKPAVAYWCNYWILNQILAKGLHNVDAEALKYTTGLMDKVEQVKGANSGNDAITDDVAGKAYVEQFALETFGKADNAVRANKVSIATADTFQAAATFMELLAIWGPIDHEMTTKTKYAKFHAVRILKAVKAGEDPNLSNPKPEPEPEELLPQLDPNDADVKAIEGEASNNRRASVVEVPDEADRLQARLAQTSRLDESLHPSREQSQARPPRPSVVEVPDEAHKIQSRLAPMSSKDESLHPSRAPSRPLSEEGTAVSPLAPQDAASYYTSNQPDISPMETTSQRKPSIGGNYFPITPGPPPNLPNVSTSPPHSQPMASPFDLPSAPGEPNLPAAPSTFGSKPSPTDLNPDGHYIPPPPPSGQTSIPPTFAPQSAPRQQFSTSPPPQLHGTSMPPSQPRAQAPPPQPQQRAQQQQQPQPPHHQVVYAPPSNQSYQPQPTVQPLLQPPVQTNVVVDEEAIMKAQKHAKWAISALNFEDVPTAIRELQGALASLGAR